ncbi:MAG TPA: SusC/RagA family TonB-linked outer membrane protein, partial [Balneolaceae bacterium]|nr:SusC/RagA family TonB-linked outer membrane protein [Balneolaceae bacterium]
NPVVTFKHTTRIQRTVHLIGSLSGTYHFEPWLSLHTQFGMDWRYVHYTRISDPIVAPAEGGFNRQDYHTTPNFDTKTTLNFSKSFNDANNVSALVGIEYRRDYTRFARVESQGFLSGRLVSVLSGGSKPTTAVGYNQEYRRGGYFANVKYNYKQRYYVNVTGRYDGSSRFGSNNRFGFFPAASAAWDISSENFFNANWVNDLKLRVSYGSSGNSELGRYRALSLFGLSGSYDGQTGLAPTQLANKNLTWEKATTLDLGIDYSMFSGRLHGSVDGYRRINSSLLLNAPLPAISGFNSIGKNIGKTRNEGVEFSLHSVNVQTGGFRWNTNFNITVQRNTVKKLIGNQKELNPGSITPVAVGHSINALKIWKWAGVDPADGRPLWYDKNGHLTHLPTNSDRQFVGSGDQSVIGGFGNSFKYKGLQLSVFFQYSYGQMAAPVDVWAFGMAQVGSTHSNGVKGLLKKAWHHQGQFAQFPYPQWGPSQYPGTQYYSDGRNGAQFYSTAYVRLKNATLSYNLPQTVVSAMHMRSVQFFVTGLNLLTFTHYPGFDPEVAGSTNGFNNSTNQRASFPAARVINGGITVKF